MIKEIPASVFAAAEGEERFRLILDEVGAGGVSGVVIVFAENGKLRVGPRRGLDQQLVNEMDGQPLSVSAPLTDAIRTGQPQCASWRGQYPAQRPAAAHLDFTGSRSFVAVPFGPPEHPLGALGVAYDHEWKPSEEHCGILRALAYLVGQTMERVRWQHERLELARILQQSMLPPLPDPFPGLELATRYAPARNGMNVGGDWYDAFTLADGSVAAVIGDVQGHDVEAVALMGQVSASVRAFASLDGQPGTVLGRTNDLLVRLGIPTFASCTFLRYDSATGTIQAARAGHLPVACAFQDGSHRLQHITGGPVLGVLPDEQYPTVTFPLPPGALLALVTDGVVEGPAQPMEDGLERVCELAADTLLEGTDLEKAADHMLALASGVGHTDDATVMLMRRTAKTVD